MKTVDYFKYPTGGTKSILGKNFLGDFSFPDIGFGDGHIYDNEPELFEAFRPTVEPSSNFGLPTIGEFGKPITTTFTPTPIVTQTAPIRVLNVTSQVIDETGNPVPFAGIYEVGNLTNWTQADINGRFSLTLKKGTQIKVDSVGFDPQIFNAKLVSNKIVLPQGKEGQLNEVVVKTYLDKPAIENNPPAKNDNWKILIPGVIGAATIFGLAYMYSRPKKGKKSPAMAGATKKRVGRPRKKTVSVKI